MPTTHEKNKITVPFTAKWRDFANQFMNNSCHPMYPLAEFIDNSIASFLIDYKKIKDIDNTSLDKVDLTGLQIDITFNYYSHDHQEIIITDNAGGMNLTTLSEAIQPYHTTDIQRDTRMNQYGVGMKFGIFWLSSGVSIYTKRRGEEEATITINITKDNLYETARATIESGITNKVKTKSGTIIHLLNIHNGNKVISESVENRVIDKRAYDNLKESLGWRYGRYIKKGLILNMKFVDKQKNKEINDRVHDFFPEPYNLNTINKSLPEIESFIKKSKKMQEAAKKLMKYTNDENAYEKLINGEDLWFKHTITFVTKDFKHQIERNLYWGVLSSKYKNSITDPFKRVNGFSLYHCGRAIYSGPNPDKPTKLTVRNYNVIDLGTSLGGQRNTIIRIFGCIDLTGLASPERNKIDFQGWQSRTDLSQAKIDETIKDLQNCALDFLNCLLDCERDAKGEKKVVLSGKKNKEQLENFKEVVNPKYFKIIDIDDKDPSNNSINIQFGDYNFVLKLCSKPFNKSHGLFIENVSDKEWHINIDVNNPLWREFFQQNTEAYGIFKTKFMFPLLLCFTFIKIYYDQEGKKTAEDLWDFVVKEFKLNDELEFDKLFMKIFEKIKIN